MDYRLILDNAPLPILVVQDGKVVYCNASGLEIFQVCGYDVDESNLDQFDFMALVPDEERRDAQTNVGLLLAGKGPLRNIPRTLVDSRGNPVQTLASASMITWEGRPAFEISYIVVGLSPVERDSKPTLGLDTSGARLRDARATAFEHLTPQETRVSVLLAEGRTTAQVAEELGIRDSTLRGYIKSVYRKLGVHSRTELVRLLLGHR